MRFRELHHVEDYAALLNCSSRTLNRITHRAVGKGPRQVIDERRILEARRLLQQDDWDARSVAAHLGFSNAANFGRFFRNHTGQPPAAATASTMHRDRVPTPPSR